jgi:quercetin dioxygenase-like cupin family protein
MIVKKLNEMKGGWFIGNFDPSLLKTDKFEVAVHSYKQGQKWPKHFHKVSTEYNCLISGSMNVCGKELKAGDLFVILPYEVAEPEFLEDCTVVIIKTPSIPGDKYEVI